jgi:hypothetical protein
MGLCPLAGDVGDGPFRPNPLTPFPAREGGKFGGVLPFPLRGGAGGEVNQPRVGPKTPANPKPTGVGKWGSRGAKPPWRGAWGCPPFTPTEVSLFEKGRPAPTLIKLGGGVGGAPSQGAWGMCPQNKKRGQVAPICQSATSGTQNVGKPPARGGGKNNGSPAILGYTSTPLQA